jgi:hypothetical protein
MASLELRVCGRYRLGRRIGRGTFGQIYLTKNIQNNMDCATKLEEIRTKYPQVYNAELYIAGVCVCAYIYIYIYLK